MRLRVGLALVLLCLAVPATAGAYVIGGSRWPGHTITYFNADRPMARAVAIAVHAWNTSGANVHFRAVRRARAHVIIRMRRTPSAGAAIEGGFCQGYSDIGAFKPVEHVDLDPACGQGILIPAAVVAHELGHILGLNHVAQGCALMTPSVWQFCPQPKLAWQYRCRLVQPDDVRGAIALYGGHLRRKPAFCDAFPAPSPPTRLTVSPDGRAISWHNPPLPRETMPGIDAPQLQALVAFTRDSCPNGLDAAQVSVLPVDTVGGKDQHEAIELPGAVGTGTWCVSLFLRDQYGRWSQATTMLMLPQQALVAGFNATMGEGRCVQFTDVSTDPGHRIVSWRWEFGDGTVDSTPAPSHCYPLAGLYLARLTVIDDAGDQATTTQQVGAVGLPPATN